MNEWTEGGYGFRRVILWSQGVDLGVWKIQMFLQFSWMMVRICLRFDQYRFGCWDCWFFVAWCHCRYRHRRRHLSYCCCFYYYYSLLVCVFIGWISCHFIIIIIRMSYYCCFVGSTSYTPHLSFQSKERWSQAVAAISFAMEHARLHVSAWKISIFKVPILKLEMGGLFRSSWMLELNRILAMEFEGILMMRAVDSRFLLLVKTPC